MNRNIFLTSILLSSAVFSVLISSCNLSQVKFGEVRMMYGDNEDGHIAYTTSTFSGIERGIALAEEGQTISFDYQASLDRGSLLIEWQTPAGEVLWHKNLTENGSGSDQLQAESPGEYNLIIQGRNAAGDFDVSWQVK